MIPTGKIDSVRDTPFDFKDFKTIGKDINIKHPQIEIGGGYDQILLLIKN